MLEGGRIGGVLVIAACRLAAGISDALSAARRELVAKVKWAIDGA